MKKKQYMYVHVLYICKLYILYVHVHVYIDSGEDFIISLGSPMERD